MKIVFSGSGKTTLLSALAGMNKSRQGVLKLNTHRLTNNMIKDLSVYVQQEDFFTESLTIEEHLKFMVYNSL